MDGSEHVKAGLEPFKTEFFDCACFTDEHLIIFHYDPEYGDLYASVHLCKMPFFHRLWAAIKHVFGYKCKYGCFDSWQLNPEQADRMISLIQMAKGKMEELKSVKEVS